MPCICFILIGWWGWGQVEDGKLILAMSWPLWIWIMGPSASYVILLLLYIFEMFHYKELNSGGKPVLEIGKSLWLQLMSLSYEKFPKLNLIFCYPSDLRKIFSRLVKLEDTVNLTFIHWCLKVSAKALCSLGEILFVLLCLVFIMFVKYLPLFLALADFDKDFQMENFTSFSNNLAWIWGVMATEWICQLYLNQMSFFLFCLLLFFPFKHFVVYVITVVLIFPILPPPLFLPPIPTVSPLTVVHFCGSCIYVLWLILSPSSDQSLHPPPLL